MGDFPSHRALAEIDGGALAANYRLLAARAAAAAGHPVRLWAVVKANAYGHGVDLVVPVLRGAGCRFFAVASVDEAAAVRAAAPDAGVLVLGYTPPDRASELFALRAAQTVFSTDYARALDSACARLSSPGGGPVRLPVHLKLDCGMGRLGFAPERPGEVLSAAALPRLSPVGLCTHFPAADTDPVSTRAQLSRFLACRAALAAGGLCLFAHTAASAALLALPETLLDGARPGMALYGVPPVPTDLALRPVLTLTAPLVQVREIEAGTPVGYGSEWRAPRRTRIGVLPIGYADGLPRGAAGFPVTLRGAGFSAPVRLVGRICMDQAMVDLGDLPAGVGDAVELFSDPVPLSGALGTIPYTLLAGLSARLERRLRPAGGGGEKA